MSTITTDQMLVEQIKALVDTKFAEASELPGAIQTKDLEGVECNKVLLSGPKDSCRLKRFSNGCIKLAYGNPEQPAYDLFLNIHEEIVVSYEGETGTEPDIAAQIELAASLPVAPNERAVYGWAKDGQIEGLFYIADIGYFELNGMMVNCAGLSGFLLEGASPLAAVKMAKEGNDEGWIGRIWQLIQSGTLLPLSKRINTLPKEVWCESTDSNLVWLRFEASDDRQPVFAAGSRYQEWHPREDVAGELLKEDTDFMEYRSKEYPSYKAALRGWFW